MPRLVPLVSIPVTRGGTRVIPPIGLAYEFTREEAEFLTEDSARPAHSGDRDGVATPAIKGATVKAASRKTNDALAAMAAAANGLTAAASGLIAAAEARQAQGTAAVPAPTPEPKTRKAGKAAPTSEDDDI